MKLPVSIQQIIDDNLSGSVTLLKRLIIELEKELLQTDLDAETFMRYITEIRRRMEMFAVIRHFCDELILSHNVTPAAYPQNYLAFISDYRNFWERAPYLMARNLEKIVDLKDSRLLLHSNSGTIREVFRVLSERTEGVSFYQTLSAPAEEGRIQAHDLAEQGYRVTLITDAAAGAVMPQTDFVILAADQMNPTSFINKTGSLQIVLAAQEFNVPVYVLTESRKSNTAKQGNQRFTDIRRQPGELLDQIRHPRINAENIYFEEVPNYLITGFITEKNDKI